MLTDLLIILGCLTALAGGVIVVFAKNPSRCILGLFLTTFCVGLLFLLLGAVYVAMVQIIVYAGAILILFLFLVRFFGTSTKRSKIPWQMPLGIIAAIVLFFQIIIPSLPYLQRGLIKEWENPPDIALFGEVLFQKYLYPFELISVLILVAIIGAVYMAREEDDDIGQNEEDSQ